MKRNQLGRRLFALRKNQGISQEKLAELADYSVDFISLVERGLNSPSLEGCERLAKALGISLKDLFDFEQSTYPEKGKGDKETQEKLKNNW